MGGRESLRVVNVMQPPPAPKLAGLAIMKTKNQKQGQLLVGKGCVRKTSKLLCIIRLCLKMFKLVLFFFFLPQVVIVNDVVSEILIKIIIIEIVRLL